MKPLILMPFALALVQADPVAAAQFCLGSGDDLQDALSAAAGNGQDDDIRLRAGTYTHVSNVNAFEYTAFENFDLSVSGGWNSNCTSFSYDPPSILDGSDARRVMNLFNAGAGTAVTLSVSRLQFRNGMADGDGGGLKIVGSDANNVDITIRHCTFLANVASTFGGGLSAGSSGTMRLDNNLFFVNDAEGSFGAAVLTSNDAVAYVVNNTVIGNEAASIAGGLRFAGSSPLELANNILWANSDLDLIVQGGTHNRYHNNIGALNAPPPGVVTGEITTDPEFQPGLLNFDPRPGGALFNGGDPAPPGGLASSDLLGRPRVDAGRVDIGAYEAEVLFYDGFDP